MNLRSLEYLVALADNRHFGKAAEICFVSQPALSMQFKKLEESLGAKLIERTNKSVLLTETGKVIAKQARGILLQIAELKETAQHARDPYSGELRLGIFPTLAPYLLPHIIPDITQHMPKIMLYLIEEKTDVLVTQLKKGQIDMALLALPITEKELIALPLFEEEFMLAVSSEHALKKKKLIKNSDLTDQALLLLENGHCLREQALSLCSRLNTTEAKNFQATSLETLRYMVAAKAGITLIPKLACKPANDIFYIPFASPKPTRSIGLISRKSNSKKKLLENMALLIQKKIKKIL